MSKFSDQKRPDRAVISVTGDGALAWLHNLITCDVEHLIRGAAAYGALLSPQGKILDDLFVLHADGRVLIDCTASRKPALLQRLMIYRLRAKLAIAAEDGIGVSVHESKPEGNLVFADPRNSDMGWRSFGAASGNGDDSYDLYRITLGLAESVADIGHEKVFPHEANFDQFGGVSFSKGCYVGQEVVSRMQHRSTARNRFLPVLLDGPLGDVRQIVSDHLVIGDIHSVVQNRALALIRIDRLADAAGPLMAGNVRAHVVKPAWITYDVTIPEAAR
jgi:tRNA-modifying protein YgfZ